ncbi:hypothetical protein HDV02_006264 [Globomyces sp. JEL0801]|nr:hypothetical protein HDV02_006264 [Globomyces sp. JEL0801]
MSAIATSSGLRSRKVDHRKQMPVYRYDQLLDLDEINSRTLSKVTTGVEKEEEEEHHLQAALLTNSVIPTPEASNLLLNPQNYDAFYPTNFHLPKSLIKFSSQIEDVMGCLYNLDEKDNAWIESLDEEIKSRTTPLAIEQTFYAFEQAGNDKFEEMSLNPESDPYVCFRHREIKQLRKVRRSDTVAQEKLHKLKEDLTRARELLQFIHEREQHCKDLLMIDHLIFEKRVTVRKIKKDLGITSNEYLDVSPDQKRKKSKKHLDDHGLKDASHLVTDMDQHLFDDARLSQEQRILEKIKREKLQNDRNGWIDHTELPFINPQDLFWGRHLGIEMCGFEYKQIKSRRRMGRGGRVVFDRMLISTLPERTMIPKPSAGLGKENHQAIPENISNTIETLEKSDGDNHTVMIDNDTEPTTIMADDIQKSRYLWYENIICRLMIYRSFHVNATEEQYKCLQTIPSYDLNFDPTQPIPDEEKHFNTIPPQIVRIPIPATTVATTPNPPATLNSTSTTTVKKKKEKTLTKKKQSSTVDTTDARSMAVKTMMKEAQKQAQEAQAQIQQKEATAKEIEEYLKLEKLKYERERNEPKILLLGASDSGKSTFLKQMKIIHSNGFTSEELEKAKRGLIFNLYSICKKVITESNLSDVYLKKFDEFKRLSIDEVREGVYDYLVLPLLQSFWNDPLLHDFYFKYDMLKLRIVTQNISENTFKIRMDGRDSTLHVIDVSGLKYHRKRWVPYFDTTTAIVFIVAISSFDQVMSEDSSTNRINDCLSLFDQVLNNPILKDCQMILFFNKLDLFEEKIARIKFTELYSDFYGTDHSLSDCLYYFEQKFLEKSHPDDGRTIMVHQTCCTDSKLMSKIISSVM